MADDPENADSPKNRRKSIRFPARWHVTVVCLCDRDNEHRCWTGKTSDVSTGGLCLETDHNVCCGKRMAIALKIPPAAAGTAPTIIHVEAEAAYTVLAQRSDRFRTGIRFRELAANTLAELDQHLDIHFGDFGKSEPE